MGATLHSQVKDYILSRIKSGEYPPKSKIPTENELVELLGVSRPTIRQALDSLTQTGYLVRVKGCGTFVKEPKLLHESTSFITGYHEESTKKGLKLHTRVIELQREKASNIVAQALNLRQGEFVTKLTRLRWLENYHDGKPVFYSTLYVPVKYFPDMTDIDFTDVSFYEILAHRDLHVEYSHKKLEVVPTPADIAENLEISPFEPSIFITAHGYTSKDVMIEYSEDYYPAGISSFLITTKH